MPGFAGRVWNSLRARFGATAARRPGLAPRTAEGRAQVSGIPVPDRPVPRPTRVYPGDYHGPVVLTYAPHPDDVPDPGEVVWTWVPFEEDYSRGKDRPVLIVARESPQWLLGLMLSSKNHLRDAAQEASEHRYWTEIGSGDWDPSGRPSAVRVNRIIRVDPRAVRRAGGKLDARRFAQVAQAVQQHLENPLPG